MATQKTQRTPKLDKKQVVETALRLLNETGLDGLSLRAIAKELDVQAPALYWHFKNKQELLDEMATEMYRRMVAASEADEAEESGEARGSEADSTLAPGPGEGRESGWRERLLASNRGLRAALLSYRDGAKVFSGTRFNGTVHAVEMERTLRIFTEAGFTLDQAVRATTTTYLYTLGYVTEEQGVQPVPGERREGFDVQERARRMADFPLSAAAGAEIFENYERHFEEGLELIVAGIGARYGIG
ncbi:TetR/AcrR family transcriptional regulator [Streptomyces sp. NPDC007084]|uniref:TetR/AcrR family transcriptional regulator n=1 Tax=Streptomyces sp. NPDC007084 TaxID=3154313 RepID=UPI0034528A64